MRQGDDQSPEAGSGFLTTEPCGTGFTELFPRALHTLHEARGFRICPLLLSFQQMPGVKAGVSILWCQSIPLRPRRWRWTSTTPCCSSASCAGMFFRIRARAMGTWVSACEFAQKHNAWPHIFGLRPLPKTCLFKTQSPMISGLPIVRLADLTMQLADCGLHGCSIRQHTVLTQSLQRGLWIKKIFTNQNKDEACEWGAQTSKEMKVVVLWCIVMTAGSNMAPNCPRCRDSGGSVACVQLLLVGA